MNRRPHPWVPVARLALLLLAAAALAGRGVEAQSTPLWSGATLEADGLYFAGSPEKALEVLTAHLETSPSDYDALWRAVRAAVVLELMSPGKGAQYRWLDGAIELGERAVAERPEGIEGLYWRGAAEGRRALYAGNDYAAELANRVHAGAHEVLALDSLHGGAHNLLGKLYYEIMDLSRIERFVARLVSNNVALRDASWEAAELHMRRATELWPDYVLFQLDLARLYERRGRKPEARETLRRVVAMPSVHPADDALKAEGRSLLAELGP